MLTITLRIVILKLNMDKIIKFESFYFLQVFYLPTIIIRKTTSDWSVGRACLR